MGPLDQARERMPGSGGGTRRELGQRGDSWAWNAVGTCRPESRCAGCRENLKDVLGRSRPERKVPALAPQGADAEAGDIADVYWGCLVSTEIPQKCPGMEKTGYEAEGGLGPSGLRP